MRYQVQVISPERAKLVYDVVVIGAGLSGLQAAHSARAAGLRVCVVEATNRVGGKTFSVHSSEKGFNDLGAAWINDTNQSEMYKLFQRYGIDGLIQRACGDSVALLKNGSAVRMPYGQLLGDQRVFKRLLEVLRKESTLVDLDNPTSSPRAKDIDNMTFKDFCIERSQSKDAADIADLMTTALLGVQSEELSALYMLHYIKSGCGIDNLLSDGKDGGQYIRNRQGSCLYSHARRCSANPAKGNQTISKRLAEDLGADTVFFRMPVTSIDQSGDICEVTTEPGNVFRGLKVIVSVPTSLYSSINFRPPLPKNKAVLSDNAVMGYYSKMIFVFKEPWWQTGGSSGVMDCETGPVSFTRDTSVPIDDQWSITCFIVGERGRQWSKLSKAARREQVWGQFSQAFSQFVDEIPQPSNVLEMEWAKQAFFLGAPCPVMTPGTLTTVGTELATPFRNVHFVGTETSHVWRGYMEGALLASASGKMKMHRKRPCWRQSKPATSTSTPQRSTAPKTQSVKRPEKVAYPEKTSSSPPSYGITSPAQMMWNKLFNNHSKNWTWEYVDLYLMHWPVAWKRGEELFPKLHGMPAMEDVDLVYTYRAMEKLLETGRTKAIGVSNFSKAEMEKLLAKTSVVSAVHQLECHPWLQQRDFSEWHIEKGIHITHYSPFGNQNTFYGLKAGFGKLIDEPVLADIGEPYGKTAAQVVIGELVSNLQYLVHLMLRLLTSAVAWGVSLGHSVIPKSKPRNGSYRTSRMISKLSPHDMVKISALNRKLRLNDFSGEFGRNLFEDLEDKVAEP
ncbi:flavin-containing amine oxidase [Penicillium lividum]|nr:flavin-containing amine oxidase [Penicillium lividum]